MPSHSPVLFSSETSPNRTPVFSSPDKKQIRSIFDGIADRYDFLNAFLSFRLDDSWRKKSRNIVFEGHEKSILDLGVGTGKFLQLFLTKKKWETAVGLDFSGAMLAQARMVLPADVRLVLGDFHQLSFPKETFDLVISAFALRSVKEMPQFLKEVFTILAPGGKTAFLCLTRPTNPVWKILYYPYLKFYLPWAGSLLTGNPKAYQFLSGSIQTFQEPDKTAAMMREAGFRSTEIHSFTGGSATLIVGKK